MKTAVEAIFVGKARQYNRRFLQMCSHHLIEPVACTPASGWEKGQVENQVGNLRDLLFRPKPWVKSLAELNAWLEDQCLAYARRTHHPEFRDRTTWEVFHDERSSLMELRGPFDGFVEKAVRATFGRTPSLNGRRVSAGDALSTDTPRAPCGSQMAIGDSATNMRAREAGETASRVLAADRGVPPRAFHRRTG
jgi:hypothetical protein